MKESLKPIKAGCTAITYGMLNSEANNKIVQVLELLGTGEVYRPEYSPFIFRSTPKTRWWLLDTVIKKMDTADRVMAESKLMRIDPDEETKSQFKREANERVSS